MEKTNKPAATPVETTQTTEAVKPKSWLERTINNAKARIRSIKLADVCKAVGLMASGAAITLGIQYFTSRDGDAEPSEVTTEESELVTTEEPEIIVF